MASDACWAAIAEKVVANLGPTNDIILELANEHFNNAFTQFYSDFFLTTLAAYYPTGTNLFSFTTTSGASSGYTAINGTPLPDPSAAIADTAYTFQAAHAYDVFTKAAVAAGLSPSRIKRSYGSWWIQPESTAGMAAAISAYSIPADYVHVGPYGRTANSASFGTACNPAGYPVGTPGNWPVDAINDFYRHQLFYSNFAWKLWLGHAEAAAPANLQLHVYECAIQHAIPETSGDFQAINTDCFYHPSYYDLCWGYFLGMQQGCPTSGYAGAIGANYFQIYALLSAYTWGTPNTYDIWTLANGVCNPPGYGLSNQYITPQGGSPATRFVVGYAQTNQPVGLQAFQDWVNLTTPFYAPAGVVFTPSPGATGVSPRNIVAIQFNEPMLGTTITSSTFTLKQNGTSVSGTVAYNPVTWTATFTPSATLFFPTIAYTAQVMTGVTNAEGTALAAPIRWGFTTGSGPSGKSLRWYSTLSRPS
jgi:hypothetical protein